MAFNYQDMTMTFFEMLNHFYSQNKNKIRKCYKDLTRKYLDFNDKSINKDAFLRKPQFEALEMYVFLKEFMKNKSVKEIFEDWKKKEGEFSKEKYILSGEQVSIYEMANVETKELEKLLKKYQERYSNYVFALAMGIGKTILIETCIFYEFLLSNKYSKDPYYCHNVIVFAPDKTVLSTLKREFQTFDKSKVVPLEYVNVIDSNVKYHFLDTDGVTLNTLDNSDFNIIISNNQKIILKRQHAEKTSIEKLFNDTFSTSSNDPFSVIHDIYGGAEDEKDLIFNQRFEKITRLPQIGVYVDEAHHLFGAELEKSLYLDDDDKKSLRNTINILAKRLNEKGTKLVGCYNYTGTPYVGKSILPEVVYSYGLKEAIANGYLKDTKVFEYENVKDIEYLKSALTDFFNKFKGKKFENMLPKIAIYFSKIDELEKIEPEIKKIMIELGMSPESVLVNVGDTKLTKDKDIKDFNELDTPKSIKQVILLVGKGTEGWNCRSLFGVALYRSPKSKVFVLQATMRCLRQITQEQQRAQIYLSSENYKILQDELNANFRMNVEDMERPVDNKKEYEVRLVPPPVKIPIKKISHSYTLEPKITTEKLDFELDKINLDKYRPGVKEHDGLIATTSGKEVEGLIVSEEIKYSEIMLFSEIARYLNMKPTDIRQIINSSANGISDVLGYVNMYNEILYDVIIPKIFNYLYEVKTNRNIEKTELLLLKEPEEGYYVYRGEPDKVVKKGGIDVVRYDDKSFHADTYIFDSNPEKECFYQYIKSDKVEKVYFTGMFTGNETEFFVQYIDPQTNKLRKYYPDLIAKMKNGKLQVIEVKGDNMIDDPTVIAKAEAAKEILSDDNMEYKFYPSGYIMKHNVLDDEDKQITVENTDKSDDN